MHVEHELAEAQVSHFQPQPIYIYIYILIYRYSNKRLHRPRIHHCNHRVMKYLLQLGLCMLNMSSLRHKFRTSSHNLYIYIYIYILIYRYLNKRLHRPRIHHCNHRVMKYLLQLGLCMLNMSSLRHKFRTSSHNLYIYIYIYINI